MAYPSILMILASPLMAMASISETSLAVFSETGWLTTWGGLLYCRPLSMTARRMWGAMILPPLAMADSELMIWMGVTAIPWPNELLARLSLVQLSSPGKRTG